MFSWHFIISIFSCLVLLLDTHPVVGFDFYRAPGLSFPLCVNFCRVSCYCVSENP